MLCVAYDAMTRLRELIAIDVEDLKFLVDGTGRLLIRRSRPTRLGRGMLPTFLATFPEQSGQLSLMAYDVILPGKPVRAYDVRATLRR